MGRFLKTMWNSYCSVTPGIVGTTGGVLAAYGFVKNPPGITLKQRATPICIGCTAALVWPVAFPIIMYQMFHKD